MLLPKHPHQWSKEGDLFPTIIIQINAWNCPYTDLICQSMTLKQGGGGTHQSWKSSPYSIGDQISGSLNPAHMLENHYGQSQPIAGKAYLLNIDPFSVAWLMISIELTGWHNSSAPTLWTGAELWVMYSIVRDSTGSPDDKDYAFKVSIFARIMVWCQRFRDLERLDPDLHHVAWSEGILRTILIAPALLN